MKAENHVHNDWWLREPDFKGVLGFKLEYVDTLGVILIEVQHDYGLMV